MDRKEMERLLNTKGHMSTTRGSDKIACPYYVGMSNREIYCEGFKECSRIITRFATIDDRVQHEKAFCRRINNSCEIALIKQIYEE